MVIDRIQLSKHKLVGTYKVQFLSNVTNIQFLTLKKLKENSLYHCFAFQISYIAPLIFFQKIFFHLRSAKIFFKQPSAIIHLLRFNLAQTFLIIFKKILFLLLFCTNLFCTEF